MELGLTTATGKASKKNIEVSDDAFARPFNEALIHQVVTAYLSGARAGTHAQKTRSMVSGGGKKPWKQKGTGRARAGTSRSPLWRGGGKTFAAVTGDYSQKVNKKMYRGAMCSILSELVRQERLVVVDDFALEAPKTKALVEKLCALNLDNALVVIHEGDLNVQLAARNLYDVDVCSAAQVSPVDLMRFERVLMTAEAVRRLEERLACNKNA